MNTMLLMMGGSGRRFQRQIPKQYTCLRGIPLFGYILQKAEELREIDNIIVVTHEDYRLQVQKWAERLELKKVRKIVAGGQSRSASVKNGLAAAMEIGAEDDMVLIHDASHPYLDEKTLRRVIAEAERYGGATCVSPNYDTVYQIDENGMLQRVLPRESVVAGASPEVFRLSAIYPVYRNASEEELERMTSAGMIALDNAIDMKAVPMEVLNLKITYERDFELFQKLAFNYFFDVKTEERR